MLGIIVSLRRKATKSGAMMAFVGIEDLSGSMELLLFPKTLEEFSHLIAEGKIIRAHGRVSISENQGVSLVCESVSAPPPLSAQPASVENGQERQISAAKTEPKKTAGRPGLYLQFESEDTPAFRKAMQYLAIFDGQTPLYLFCRDTKKLKAAPPNRWVDVNPPLLHALQKLLGERNVVLREPEAAQE